MGIARKRGHSAYVAVHDDKPHETCFIRAVREDTAVASPRVEHVGESRREHIPGRKVAQPSRLKRPAKTNKNRHFKAG
jgi:hypothetical protein